MCVCVICELSCVCVLYVSYHVCVLFGGCCGRRVCL